MTIERLKVKARLHAVQSAEQPMSDAGHAEQRRHILSRDWAKVHVAADKRSPFGSVLRRGR